MPVKAPAHELPGGSHCSPASTVPSPHSAGTVVVVEVDVVVVAGTLVVVVARVLVVVVARVVVVVLGPPGHVQSP